MSFVQHNSAGSKGVQVFGARDKDKFQQYGGGTQIIDGRPTYTQGPAKPSGGQSKIRSEDTDKPRRKYDPAQFRQEVHGGMGFQAQNMVFVTENSDGSGCRRRNTQRQHKYDNDYDDDDNDNGSDDDNYNYRQHQDVYPGERQVQKTTPNSRQTQTIHGGIGFQSANMTTYEYHTGK